MQFAGQSSLQLLLKKLAVPAITALERQVYLLERKGQMLDPTQAQLWFQHADRAIIGNNVEALRTAIHQLVALLPQQQEARGYGGGTIRARGQKG